MATDLWRIFHGSSNPLNLELRIFTRQTMFNFLKISEYMHLHHMYQGSKYQFESPSAHLPLTMEIQVTKSFLERNDENLKELIENDSFNQYQQKSKPLQVQRVINLIRGQNTFLLVATGFGKSQIPEMYLNMTTKDRSGRCMGVVVVLNPLDALGNNQVVEKVAAVYSAINLR